jgi:hypothetical protein
MWQTLPFEACKSSSQSSSDKFKLLFSMPVREVILLQAPSPAAF